MINERGKRYKLQIENEQLKDSEQRNNFIDAYTFLLHHLKIDC